MLGIPQVLVASPTAIDPRVWLPGLWIDTLILKFYQLLASMLAGCLPRRFLVSIHAGFPCAQIILRAHRKYRSR